MVSCSSNEDPEQVHKYLELAGTWKTPYVYGGRNYTFNIDKDGNFSFNSSDIDNWRWQCYYYAGKLADNFDYPYTIELVYNIYSSVLLGHVTQAEYDNTYKALKPQQQIGKFTFIDASTCEAHFYELYRWDNKWLELIYDGITYPNRSYFKKL